MSGSKKKKQVPCDHTHACRLAADLPPPSPPLEQLPPPPPLEQLPPPPPMRTPPGWIALASPTTVFLFSVTWHRSHAFSILEPVISSA